MQFLGLQSNLAENTGLLDSDVCAWAFVYSCFLLPPIFNIP